MPPTAIGHWKLVIGHLTRRIHSAVREFSGLGSRIDGAKVTRYLDEAVAFECLGRVSKMKWGTRDLSPAPTSREGSASVRAEPRRDAAGSPPPVAGRRLDPPGLLLPGGILPAWGVAVHFGLVPGVLLSNLGAVDWT